MSPFVSLLAGPPNNHPMVFKVHKEVLLRIPFFQAALRTHGYIEAQEEKIHFVEQSPDLFHKVVQFMYEGDCHPRMTSDKLVKGKMMATNVASKSPVQSKIDLEVPLMVVRDVPYPVPEIYSTTLFSSVACGAHLTTTETFTTVREIIEVLCLAQRYEITGLSARCLEKLKLCPFGTREVAALVESVLIQVQETQASAAVYEFLYHKVGLHRTRLDSCVAFQALYTIPSIQASTINMVLSKGQDTVVDFIHTSVAMGHQLAHCKRDVKVSDSLSKYGPDNTFISKFGSANKGEMFAAKQITVDKRRLIMVSNNLMPGGMVYPVDFFVLLEKAKPGREG